MLYILNFKLVSNVQHSCRRVSTFQLNLVNEFLEKIQHVSHVDVELQIEDFMYFEIQVERLKKCEFQRNLKE